MDIEYPCYRKWYSSKLVVLFTAENTGTVVVKSDGHPLHEYREDWRETKSTSWVKCPEFKVTQYKTLVKGYK